MPFKRQLEKLNEWLRNIFSAITFKFNRKKRFELISILKSTDLFRQLTDEKIKKLCTKSKVKIFNAGKLIVREGEVGNSCYIIITGSVRVFVYDASGKEIVLARLEEGQYFGEQALLLEGIGRRNASVRALSSVYLLKISRKKFHEILELDFNLKKSLVERGKQQLLSRIISGHHLYQSFQKELFENIDKHLHPFKTNDVIYAEGDKADGVYLLISGIVEVSITDVKLNAARKVLVHAGHFFGEYGVILNVPRVGTARAMSDVEVVFVEAEKFLNIYNSMPDLREMFGAINAIYQLSSYGIADQFIGKIYNKPAIFTTYKMNDGSIITATKLVGSNIFSISREKELHQVPGEELRTFYYEDNQRNLRKIIIYKNQCLHCSNVGSWEELGKVCVMILERTFISDEQIQQFIESGSLYLPSAEKISPDVSEQVICDCMQVTRATLLANIEAGLTDFKVLSAKTGAGSICGTCIPKILALTGHDNWYPVKISDVTELTKHIRSYRLLPLNNIQLPKFKPGQYIIIQAQINDRWIERPYTISSYSEQPEYFEVTVKLEPLGLFSNWLFSHAQTNKTKLRISPPQGDFVLNTLISRPAICFVGGLGVTPVMAFILALDEKKSRRRLHIDYSIHSQDSSIFLSNIQNKMRENPKISLKLRDTTRQGRIKKEDILSLIVDLPNADIFICGPVEFRNFILETVKDHAIGKVYIENFTHAGGPVVNQVAS